ncbi:MAG: hypothetical protein KGJ23_00520 [Euryarchaeota archaeon]|nr:hypothetical protein [Euryarchaeota archaeon]MDE1835080.1 hypothetical protein [Euryarchaeota archaeon]MDE1879351.1 hypothetical protein [Euryarchaeota archaeon]MDE2044958.1 hypothetical protein [Thermoplasmata archaeon]
MSTRALESAPIPRWESRPRHPSGPGEPKDFGDWHKQKLPRRAYCMDVDKIEYRILPDGTLDVVGLYDLIAWDRAVPPASLLRVLAPYAGKESVMLRLGEVLSVSQRHPVPSFFVWHRKDLSEFVVGRAGEWDRTLWKLSEEEFQELLLRLPDWEVPSPWSGGT